MKLGEDVLVEIIAIVQKGLLRQEDVSQQLRDVELTVDDDKIVLSEDYLKRDGRDAPV